LRPRTISLLLAAVLLTAACLAHAQDQAKRVVLPLTLDYSFLRAALVRSWFTGSGGSAVAAQRDDGCTLITLANPRLAPAGGLVMLTVDARVRAGVSLWGGCFDPVDWSGQVELRQRVWVDPASLRLRVATQDSRLLDSQGREAHVAGLVYRLVQENVHAYLDQFTVNLAPPLTDLKTQLPLMARPAVQERLLGWLATLRPAGVTVGSDAVRVSLAMRVSFPRVREEPLPPAPPGPEAVAAFARYWEAWDAYLVRQILSLAGHQLTPGERDQLTTVLLDMRHGFAQALEAGSQDRGLVKRQVLEAWRGLAPILRKYLLKRPGESLYSYLALFTAMDALTVLEELGPAVGLEISREGLMRLAHLLDPQGPPPSLDYGEVEREDLRRLLGLGPPLKRPRTPAAQPRRWEGVSRLWDWLWPRAWAAPPRPGAGEMGSWLPPDRQGLAAYLKRMRAVLEEAAAQALAKGSLASEHHDFFGPMILATAWQESCWRQFVAAGGGPRPLISSNLSSVGVMQVNQRVWRGLYHLPSLRWDVGYNARAGSEIMELYVRRYAVGRLDHGRAKDQNLMARLVYAMYNGGPSQFADFLRRRRQGRLWLSDRLFWEKYQRVREGDFSGLGRCLVGG